MSGKMKNRGCRQRAPNRTQRCFRAFENARGMKAAGNRVRPNWNVRDDKQTGIGRRSRAAYDQGGQVGRNRNVGVHTRFRVGPRRVDDGPALDQIMAA